MRDREIFERFLREEEGIKESWRIFEIFEEERRKWQEELARLKEDRKIIQETVDALALRAIEIQEEIKQAQEALQEREKRLISEALPSIEAMRLHSVEVIGKGGKIIKAKPARDYYPEAYVARLFRELEELSSEKGLKERILDLELENAKLKVELRDLLNEPQEPEETPSS